MPIKKRPYTLSPASQALIDLTTPLKIEYDNAILAELNKPGGGSLKGFLSWEAFLREKLNMTQKEIVKVKDTINYHDIKPKILLEDARKQLLQKLIKLENEKPGRSRQAWKL